MPPIAWVLYVANIFWATAYDTWYAMVDRDDDLRAGAKSTAILFGDLDLVALGILQALFLAGLAAVVCFFRIGYELTRGQSPKVPIRRRDRPGSGRVD